MCNAFNTGVTFNRSRGYGCCGCNRCGCYNNSTFNQRVCRDCCGNIRVNECGWGCGFGWNNACATSNASETGSFGRNQNQSFTCISVCGNGSNWQNLSTASSNEYNGASYGSRCGGNTRSCGCYGY